MCMEALPTFLHKLCVAFVLLFTKGLQFGLLVCFELTEARLLLLFHLVKRAALCRYTTHNKKGYN